MDLEGGGHWQRGRFEIMHINHPAYLLRRLDQHQHHAISVEILPSSTVAVVMRKL